MAEANCAHVRALGFVPLFLCQCHIVFIIMSLSYTLRSGILTSPALLLCSGLLEPSGFFCGPIWCLGYLVLLWRMRWEFWLRLSWIYKWLLIKMVILLIYYYWAWHVFPYSSFLQHLPSKIYSFHSGGSSLPGLGSFYIFFKAIVHESTSVISFSVHLLLGHRNAIGLYKVTLYPTTLLYLFIISRRFKAEFLVFLMYILWLVQIQFNFFLPL